MNGISWEELPNLFQQALELTYKLGTGYLWIDSLCILQDDEEDWSREAKKMAGIYANAKLTLAANCAKDSGGKMVYTADERKIGIKVEGLESFGVTDEIYVRIAPPHDLERAPLLQRAWVFQERLLSPRYLHFSPLELIWECNKKIVCQCSGSDILNDVRFHEQDWGRFAKLSFSRSIDWEKEPRTFRDQRWRSWTWNMIIQEYSKQGITRREDRLPAIAGMAKQFRYFGQTGKYLAGLWKDDFFCNLLWHASANSANMPRASEWIAPTWSWASVGAGVEFFNEPESELEVNDRVRLLDTMCEPQYEDDTLNLKSAYVAVSGPSFKATIERKDSNAGRVTYVLTKDGVTSRHFRGAYDLSEPGLSHVQSGSEVICLEVADLLIYGSDGFGMYSLALREFAKGKFERIGITRWEKDIRKVSDTAEMGSFKIF